MWTFNQANEPTLALPGVWGVLHVVQQLNEMFPGCWQDVARVQACQTAYYTDCQGSHAASLIIQGHKESLQPAHLAGNIYVQLQCIQHSDCQTMLARSHGSMPFMHERVCGQAAGIAVSRISLGEVDVQGRRLLYGV